MDLTYRISQNLDIDSGLTSRAFEFLVKDAAELLGTDRVSIWSLRNGGQDLVCEILWEHGAERVSSGQMLQALNYPAYFTFFHTDAILVADDAHTHRHTMEFSKDYLKPLGIQSMMDLCIRDMDGIWGIMCFEHVGEPRQWSEFDQMAAYIYCSAATRAVRAEQTRVHSDEYAASLQMAALGEMAVEMAHQINNPLLIISGMTDLVRHALQAGALDKVPERLGRIDTAVRRIVDIVHGLEGPIARKSMREPVAVRRVVTEAERLIVGHAKSIGVRWDICFDYLGDVCCDVSEIAQSLAILLLNSLDAVKTLDVDSQWVRLNVRATENDRVEFRVIDGGAGISEGTLAQIFDPFFTTKQGAARTGMGLTIAKRFVAHNYGHLHYLLDNGHTAFSIQIPKMDGSA